MRKEGKGFFKIISYVVIAFFIISIFLIGSLADMLGQKGERSQFITVEGREIMTKELRDSAGEKLKEAGNNPTQIQMMVFQQAQGYINRMVFLLEANRQGMEPTLQSLSLALKDKYEEAKKAFEQQYKTKYPYSYYIYLESMKDSYILSVLSNNMNTATYIDSLSIRKEYALKNTKSQVEYVIANFSEYLKNITIPQDKLMEAYNKEKDLFLESAAVKFQTYKTQEAAAADLKKLKENKEYQKTVFQKNKLQTLKPGDLDEFFKIKAAGANNVSDVLMLKNDYSIAFVESLNYTPLAKLKEADLTRIKGNALSKEREKYFKEFQEKAKTVLEKSSGSFEQIAKQNKMGYGKTNLFSILKNEPVKEEKSEKPLSDYFPGENQEFFKNAFIKEGTVSPVLQWGDYIYKIKVLKIAKPVFPMPEKDKEEIAKSLKEREQKSLYADAMMDVRSKYNVKYNWKNLNQLFGVHEKEEK